MNDGILLEENVPVSIKFMPRQIEIVIAGLNELPRKISQPVFESIVNQCQEQAVKPEKVDEPAKS